jgi:2,4-dienoyl-CoA reductase-like NADH-dependent reductase (Old Yellow Enzyme family)
MRCTPPAPPSPPRSGTQARYLFKGDAPVEDFAKNLPEPAKTVTRLFGGRFLKTYPYSDGYFLRDARQVRAAVSLPMVLLGGVTSRAVIDQAMAEGFQFVAMGRALLREPDLVNRMRQDPGTRSLCIHCNKCMTTIYASGTRCVLVPGPGTPPPSSAALAREGR